MLHWSLIAGGLLVIVDLATMAVQQSSGGACAALGSSSGSASTLSDLDLVLNYVILVAGGWLVERDTGKIWLAVLAGLLAAVLDQIVVLAASGVQGCFSPTFVRGSLASDLAIGIAINLAMGPVLMLGGALVRRYSAARPRT